MIAALSHDDVVRISIGAAVSAVGLVLTILWWTSTKARKHHHPHVRAGASTTELGPEAPATVSFLVHHEVNADAFAATVLDLDARDHIELFEPALDACVIFTRNVSPPGDALSFPERHVLALLHQLSVDGSVTPAALAAAIDERHELWVRFEAGVQDDAFGAQLLARRRLGQGTAWALFASLILFLGGITVAEVGFALFTVPLLAFFLVRGFKFQVTGVTPHYTADGVAATSRWLGVREYLSGDPDLSQAPAGAVAIWDRYLAYGAAMGLTPTAVKGVIEQLRTKLDPADLRRMKGMDKNPEQKSALFAEEAASRRDRILGPGVASAQVMGDGSGDFWALTDRMRLVFPILRYQVQVDTVVTGQALAVWFDQVVAKAPAEWRNAMVIVEPHLRRLIDRMKAGEVVFTHEMIAELTPLPEPHGATDFIVQQIRAHYGLAPSKPWTPPEDTCTWFDPK